MTGGGVSRMVRIHRFLAWLLVSVSLVVPTLAAQPDERGLRKLWQAHAAPPHDHAGLLAACRDFAAKHGTDPLLPVSRTLAAWNLLQLGRADEARAVFRPYAATGSDPVRNAATALALAWLTRLDRERVKAALQYYYRRNIAYPRKLAELAAYPELPDSLAFEERDRWSLFWDYGLTGLKTIPGLLDQKYKLQSQRLGDGSDLAGALDVPCGRLLRVEPVRIRSAAPGREIVELRVRPAGGGRAAGSGKLVVATVGSWSGTVYLAYVGRTIIIVSDYHHWKVLPVPGARQADGKTH